MNQKINLVLLNKQALAGIVGIVSNFLVIGVFRRKRLKNASYSIYFRAMVSIEILVLLHSFRHWSRQVIHFDLNLVSKFLCKFNEFQAHVAGFASTWLLTVILIDRYFTIVYHNRFKILKRRWFQLTLIALVISYSIALHSTMPLNYDLIIHEKNRSSQIICRMSRYSSSYLYGVFFANHSIHLGINFLLHIKLIWFIFQSRRRILTRTNSLLARDLKFAISSIALVITTFFFRLPFVIWLLSTNMNLSDEAKQTLFNIGITVIVISHGASFFVNMAFNSIFYEECLMMFQRRRSRSKSASIRL